MMVAAVLLAVAQPIVADTETFGGYTWTYRINGDTAEIYNDGGVAVSPAPTDVLSIPSTLGGKTVTSIGNDAFRDCISLTGVTIPDTVTKIGSGAFYGCEQLTLLKIPDSVLTIANYAFYNCAALSSLHIGSGVEQINFFTFGHCRSLMNLDIPDKVTAIAASAFYGCTGLTSVTIPRGVTSINGGAFEACDNLRTFVVAEGNTSFSVKDGLLYNKEGTCLIRCPYGLTEVVVPNGVMSIGYRAFSANNSLVKVTLPEGVEQIDDCAFIYCRGLKDLTIPNGVTSIGDSVFQFCGKLANISFPASLSTIGGGEFYGCSSLTNIIFGGNAPNVGNNCFAGVASSCTVRVSRDSSGWGVDIPGTWNGMRIEYLPVMVTDVIAKQRYPWNGLVDIDCNVTCGDPTTNISLYVSAKDTAANKSLVVRSVWLENDATHTNTLEVKSGTHRLVWDAGKDNPNFVGDAVTVEVQALLGGHYLVIDLSGGPDAASYPISYLGAEPQGGWTDEYKTTKLVLRLIEPGTFMMGSPINEYGRVDNEDLHKVTISRPFYMGVFEISRKQYYLVTGVSSSRYGMETALQVSYDNIRGNSLGGKWPMCNDVDSGSFMGRLRQKTNLVFDLPTEAQWEYACRAGTTSALYSGKELTSLTGNCGNLDEIAWYHPKSSNQTPSRAGMYKPNAFGLYDMLGGTAEWCLDWYVEKTGVADAVNPHGPETGVDRVLRGGGHSYRYGYAKHCRSASRINMGSSQTSFWNSGWDWLGFRICLGL